jgi:hypothetical protein
MDILWEVLAIVNSKINEEVLEHTPLFQVKRLHGIEDRKKFLLNSIARTTNQFPKLDCRKKVLSDVSLA